MIKQDRPTRDHRSPTKVIPALMLGCLMALSACSTSAPAKESARSDARPGVTPELRQALAAGYKGSFDPPPTSGPKAVRGKTVWEISCGESFYACHAKSTAFKQAGTALGWHVVIQDGKATATTAAGLIRQAIASKVDAVVVDSYDCPSIKSALLEAKAAHLPVANFDSAECNDPVYGGKDPALFTFTTKVMDYARPADYWAAWAEARADYISAHVAPGSKIVWLTEQSYLKEQVLGRAFTARMAKDCPSCRIVESKYTFAQVPNPATQIWQTSIESNPDASAVAYDVDSLMPAGLQGVLQKTGRHDLLVGGGEGFPSNFDLIRSGLQTFAVAVPNEWPMWGTADDLNRVFAGVAPADLPSQGGGWQFVDADHNLPAKGGYVTPVDYQKAYKAIWNGS